MQLSQLNQYDNIVIQCHDNPDPDAIAAGFGLYKYFKSQGKKVRLIYSGYLEITKANILLFIKELSIPLEYVQTIASASLLITVDCQYGAGNVTKFDADTIAIIDHHKQEIKKGIEYIDIRDDLASTSTMVWELLVGENFEIDNELQTALYYGLLTDSSNFTEITHPLDKDMYDTLNVDKILLHHLRNSVLSLRELEIAGMALIRNSYNSTNQFVIIRAQECDPNILGFISDLALQVDSVLVCLVYNEMEEGIKFSVRSCTREVRANELAAYLAEDLGSGGGHSDKAGGFLNDKSFRENHKDINTDEYFLTRLTAYYQSFEVIDTMSKDIDLKGMKDYRRRRIPVGVVNLQEVLPVGSHVMIRTLQDDLEIKIEENKYLVIDDEGRVTLVDKEHFQNDYEWIESIYVSKIDYYPSLRNKVSGEIIYLKKYIKRYLFKGRQEVYAKILDKPLKLFGPWNRQHYMYGQVGDYIVVNKGDLKEAYIVKGESFKVGYKQITEDKY